MTVKPWPAWLRGWLRIEGSQVLFPLKGMHLGCRLDPALPGPAGGNQWMCLTSMSLSHSLFPTSTLFKNQWEIYLRVRINKNKDNLTDCSGSLLWGEALGFQRILQHSCTRCCGDSGGCRRGSFPDSGTMAHSAFRSSVLSDGPPTGALSIFKERARAPRHQHEAAVNRQGCPALQARLSSAEHHTPRPRDTSSTARANPSPNPRRPRPPRPWPLPKPPGPPPPPRLPPPPPRSRLLGGGGRPPTRSSHRPQARPGRGPLL